jgi:hypothetical protein
MFRCNKNAVPSLRWLAVGAATVAATACTPIVGRDLGGGDYAVTTRIRLQGADEAGEQNAWYARQQCPDGYLVLDDKVITDESGTYRHWLYGCLAPRAERGSVSSR